MTPARGGPRAGRLTGQALAAPAPAAAHPGQMKGQAGQADEQKAGHIEDRAGRRAGGVENKRDGERDGRDDGEHGMSFRSPGRNNGTRTPASVKREVISVPAVTLLCFSFVEGGACNLGRAAAFYPVIRSLIGDFW